MIDIVPFNAVEALRETGVVTARTAERVITVLSGLSEEEVRLIGSLDARIKAAMTPEVLAHSEEGAEDTRAPTA